MAQFSLNNVHKRGLKHHHFISFHWQPSHRKSNPSLPYLALYHFDAGLYSSDLVSWYMIWLANNGSERVLRAYDAQLLTLTEVLFRLGSDDIRFRGIYGENWSNDKSSYYIYAAPIWLLYRNIWVNRFVRNTIILNVWLYAIACLHAMQYVCWAACIRSLSRNMRHSNLLVQYNINSRKQIMRKTLSFLYSISQHKPNGPYTYVCSLWVENTMHYCAIISRSKEFPGPPPYI